MKIIDDLKALDPHQRATVFAAVLGWTLDAFDFFLMVFMLKAIAADLGAKGADATAAVFLTQSLRPISAIEEVSYAIFLTLAFRPVGALGLWLVGGPLWSKTHSRHCRPPLFIF